MRTRCCWLMLVLAFPLNCTIAEEPPDIAGTYRRIVADYQRIVGATENVAARAAARRLTRAAYRQLIEKAKAVEASSADDLHALGQCHEAIGGVDTAKELYTKSLEVSPAARTYLSLARVNLRTDLRTAERYFSKAAELAPAHPDLNRFRLSLAAAHQRQRDWNGAIPYLEHLLAYTKILADRTPASERLRVSHDAVQQQLDRTRRFAGMTGKVAPEFKAQRWAQGEATRLGDLKGKVVLVDFCAMWARPSRDRMERLKTLQQDGVEVIGLTLAYKHKYDAETDEVKAVDDLTLEEEAAGLAAFAKKHGIPWRLALIGREVVDDYGVATLPHTVAIDKKGNVKAILLGDDKADEDFETIVKGLVATGA